MMIPIKKIVISTGLTFALMGPIQESQAIPQCALTATTCIDATPCKTINGSTACLSTAVLPVGATRLSKSCWDVQKAYACDPIQIDTCTAFISSVPGGCILNSQVCAQNDPSTGLCVLYNKAYACGP